MPVTAGKRLAILALTAVSAAAIGQTAFAPPARSGVEALYQPRDETERAAQLALDKHCSRCHQAGRLAGKAKPSKGFGEVMQLDRLANNPDYILPGNPDGSKLFQQIVNKNMPYDVYQEGAFDKPSVAAEEIEAIRTWISGLDTCTSPRVFSAAEIVTSLNRDLLQLPEHERQTTRYVSLAHLAGSCASAAELEVYRQGLIKLLNSLSGNSDVLALQAVDGDRLLIRFNLADLGWTPATWEHIVGLYPYAVRPADSEFDVLSSVTGSAVPFVRGDWLAFFASRPPLYERILGLPGTFQALQQQLGVDVAGNIRHNRVDRAGFKESGVSQHNRLIERHTIATGAFWTSYDFGGTKGRQNLLEFPLGPEGASEGTGYGDDFAFHHDGGESIFNLPNGFQAYYLNTAKGEKLDRGPTTIVRDPDRTDLAVTNGISCMGCHDQGMKNATDEIRAHVMVTKTFPLDAREKVKAIYPEKTELDQLIAQDRERFVLALKRAGLDPALKNGNEEPINALSNRYERDVDLKSAAAEFGVSIAELRKVLGSAGNIGASFAAQLDQGKIQRDMFETEFGGIVERIIDARFVPPGSAPANFAALKQMEVVHATGGTAPQMSDLRLTLFAEPVHPRVGDKPRFTVRTDRDCNLTLINVDRSSRGTVIFPNRFRKDNRIGAGRDFTFPAQTDRFDFKFLDAGVETVIAICDVSGTATAGIRHDFDVSEFTQLGEGAVVTRKIDVVKRPAGKKASGGQPSYSGVGRAAIKIEVD